MTYGSQRSWRPEEEFVLTVDGVRHNKRKTSSLAFNSGMKDSEPEAIGQRRRWKKKVKWRVWCHAAGA